MYTTHTKQGRVSAYGFGCGYVERKECNGIASEVYMEHGVYHVRQYDYRDKGLGMRAVWVTAHDCKTARRMFDLCAGHLNAGR